MVLLISDTPTEELEEDFLSSPSSLCRLAHLFIVIINNSFFILLSFFNSILPLSLSVVLTPNYLQNKACVDQYNIALCCNRRANRDVLAPVYVHSVDIMPTYMGLVQYVDCRCVQSSSLFFLLVQM